MPKSQVYWFHPPRYYLPCGTASRRSASHRPSSDRVHCHRFLRSSYRPAPPGCHHPERIESLGCPSSLVAIAQTRSLSFRLGKSGSFARSACCHAVSPTTGCDATASYHGWRRGVRAPSGGGAPSAFLRVYAAAQGHRVRWTPPLSIRASGQCSAPVHAHRGRVPPPDTVVPEPIPAHGISSTEVALRWNL